MAHSIWAVPVPALDAVVRARTAFYDASFVSTDPGFVHAHITVLGPWLDSAREEDLARVAEIAQDTEPFEITLAVLGEFPDGIIYLRPEPEQPLRTLTARLAAAFPQCPPYGGRFDDLVPHLTLDQRSDTVTLGSVRDRVERFLPLRVEVDRLDLQWWDNHDCRLLGSVRLGQS